MDLDTFMDKFDAIWRSIILIQGSKSASIIDRQLSKETRLLTFMLTIASCMAFLFTFIGVINFELSTLATLPPILFTIYLTLGYIYILRLAVALISTGYQLIEKRLETLITSDTNLGHIRLCRQCHNQLIQATDIIGVTFKHSFSAYICLFVPQFVIGFFQLTDSAQPRLINATSVSWYLVNLSAVITLSRGLAALNTLPQAYYLTLYLTSFGSIDDLVKLEVLLLLLNCYLLTQLITSQSFSHYLVNN